MPRQADGRTSGAPLGVVLLVIALVGCSSASSDAAEAEATPSKSVSVTSPESVARETPSTVSDAVDTKDALARFQRLMGPETFRSELTVSPRSCPLADADALFDRIADQIDDDDVVRVIRNGWFDSLLVSLPKQSMSVAMCAANRSIPNSTIESVRLEVRPASETIESLLDLTMEPLSVSVHQGRTHRGGAFYQYCGARPNDDSRKACASGWRNSDLDIALTFIGVEADGVDLTAAEEVLVKLLDGIVRDLAK